MKNIVRTFVNNGFVVLAMLLAVVLYLMYSDRIKQDHGLIADSVAEAPNDTTSESHAVPKESTETALLAQKEQTVLDEQPVALIMAPSDASLSTSELDEKPSASTVEALPSSAVTMESIQALLRSGQRAAAIEGYQQLMAKEGASPQLLGSMGDVYQDMGAHAQAAATYYFAGQLALRQQDEQAVQKAIRILSALEPQAAQALIQQWQYQQQTAMQPFFNPQP